MAKHRISQRERQRYSRDEVEQRARFLAQSAGVNPDEMAMHEARQQMRPIWHQFLAAAHDELKIETAPKPMPQPDEYSEHGIVALGDHHTATVRQLMECMRYGNVVGGALCPDGHIGYAQPVGGVIAYENQISVSGVGMDIACGNKAVRLDLTLGDISDRLDDIADNIGSRISFGMSTGRRKLVEHEIFEDPTLWNDSGMAYYKDQASGSLGTVGGGNHYVDVFVERIRGKDLMESPIWVGVHFGSRGLGHTVAQTFLQKMGIRDDVWAAPAIVDVDSDIGRQYVAAMTLSGMYAYAGRDLVVQRVVRTVGGEITKTVHNHHNFAWEEEHDGRKLWVVRKGATPAFPGQEGFVGGSMGDDAVILEGVDSDLSRKMFHSTVHGAGRTMSRNAAIKTYTREQMDHWVTDLGVRLKGGSVDESPMAYRRLTEVLGYCSDSIKVNHVLKPLIVAMAGRDTVDPWKD